MENMMVNEKLVKTWKGNEVGYLKVLCQHLPRSEEAAIHARITVLRAGNQNSTKSSLHETLLR
jgi:hypothetical protein